jgi:hypothetical protein
MKAILGLPFAMVSVIGIYSLRSLARRVVRGLLQTSAVILAIDDGSFAI